MGGDARRAESHGGAWKTEPREHIGKQRHVQLPDFKYLVLAAHSGQRDRLPKRVRERGSHGDRGGRDCGDND